MAEKKDSGEPNRKYWEDVKEKILENEKQLDLSVMHANGAKMQDEILLKFVQEQIDKLPEEIDKIIEEVKKENA